MPINKHLSSSLKKEYGYRKGKSIYFAMENSKGRTGRIYKKGLKTALKEGHTIAHFPKKKK